VFRDEDDIASGVSGDMGRIGGSIFEAMTRIGLDPFTVRIMVVDIVPVALLQTAIQFGLLSLEAKIDPKGVEGQLLRNLHCINELAA
jgi:hypothetical protein